MLPKSLTLQSLNQAFRHIGGNLIIICWLILLWTQQPRDSVGTDFYPIYVAGHALMAGIDLYGTMLTAELVRTWNVPFASAGFVYPLPFVIGIWPLVLLPLWLAVVAWTLAGALGSFIAIRLRADWRTMILLPFCFMPLHRAIVMKQATLIWFALIIVLIFAMRQRRPLLVGWCIALLPAKPQVGLLFALVGLVWACKENQRALLWAGVWATLLWGGSFLLQPDWVRGWLVSVAHYNDIVDPPSLLPWGLLLLAVTWRLPWYARLAAAQVVLFPVSDIYSALPLLLVWIGIGGPLALFGSSISWIWMFAGLPNTTFVFWTLLMLPLIVCASWHAYRCWHLQRITTVASQEI